MGNLKKKNGFLYLFFKLGPVYQLGVGNPQKFESDVRAIEAELNVPPERWIQIEFKGMGNALVFNILLKIFIINKNLSSIITQLIIFGLLISPLIYMARKMKSFKITDIMVINFELNYF